LGDEYKLIKHYAMKMYVRV